jgi:RNA polymerase sigma-70 factor (ECF subfamily)
VTALPAPAPSPLDVREVYEAEFDWVWRTFRRLGVPERDLEDLAHDLFVVVHKRADDYDPSRPIRPWLFGIAYRLASDHRRKKASSELPSDAMESRAADAPGPDAHAEANESRALILRALATLDLDFRAVLVSHDLDGLAAPAIAEALGIPLNTVYSRLRLARAKLAAALRGATHE